MNGFTGCHRWGTGFPCSYSLDGTNFTGVPKNALASIQSSTNCTWLEAFLYDEYDPPASVWRDFIPTAIYNPEFTSCYSEQFIDYFNITSDDMESPFSVHWFVPCGLGSLALQCVDMACSAAGITGRPDIAGIGVS